MDDCSVHDSTVQRLEELYEEQIELIRGRLKRFTSGRLDERDERHGLSLFAAERIVAAKT